MPLHQRSRQFLSCFAANIHGHHLRIEADPGWFNRDTISGAYKCSDSPTETRPQSLIRMLFSNTRTLPSSDPQIILDDMNVRREQNCKFFRINIDTKLNFIFHISHVCGKIARSVGIFYRLQYYFSWKILVNLYYSLVYPYLLYCVISWVLIPVALLL